jgi:phytoene synthase
MQYEIARARGFFESGLRVTEQIPRRAAVCVLTMAGIYIQILKRLSDDPYLPLRQRASVSTTGKLAIMLQSWLQTI